MNDLHHLADFCLLGCGRGVFRAKRTVLKHFNLWGEAVRFKLLQLKLRSRTMPPINQSVRARGGLVDDDHQFDGGTTFHITLKVSVGQ